MPKHKEKNIHKNSQMINNSKEFGPLKLDCVEGFKGNIL